VTVRYSTMCSKDVVVHHVKLDMKFVDSNESEHGQTSSRSLANR
jgi:hypothetical protein